MREIPDPANGVWHLDKRVPIALILTIIVQTALVSFWVGQLSHRLDGAIESNKSQDVRLSTVETATNAQAVAAATTSAQLTAVREALAELKTAQNETNRLLREVITERARP